MTANPKYFWVRGWTNEPSTKDKSHGPWWVSGERGDPPAVQYSICLLLRAENPVVAAELADAMFDVFDIDINREDKGPDSPVYAEGGRFPMPDWWDATNWCLRHKRGSST